MVKYKKIFDKALAYFKKNGVRETMRRICRKFLLMCPVDYDRWLRKHRLSQKENRILRRQYGAIIEQIECCSSPEAALRAKKPYVLIVQEGSRLEEDALPLFAETVSKNLQADLFYCDSDRLLADGTHVSEPLLKPDFDDILLEGMSYVNGGFLVKRELLRECGQEIISSIRDSAYWAYRLFCICSQRSRGIQHIAKVLYHAPAEEAILYRDIKKQVVQEKQPMVSVLIPNKDQADMLKNCVQSIGACADGIQYEILILENNSQEEETFACYQELEESGRARILYWKEGFNYSAVNNYGAAQAVGDYLLFLNNDTQMQSRDAIAQMLSLAQREDVGAVGAKLLYPDGTIQHAGVILGYGGIAGHVFEGMTEAEVSDIPWSRAVRQYSAVTAACMMVKKEIFEAVGGFDENLRVAYNDIDLCLRIRAEGKKVLYTPFAVLTHYESATRGLELTKEKAQRVNKEAELFCARWEKELAAGDSFYNPNLTLEKNDYSLRR